MSVLYYRFTLLSRCLCSHTRRDGDHSTHRCTRPDGEPWRVGDARQDVAGVSVAGQEDGSV
jgi:hypothetical protein